jgi:hypothetical protein
MAIIKGNTAPTPAKLLIALEVSAMSEEMFNAEKIYQATMTIAKSMLAKNLITAEEYSIIDTKMLEKYKPAFGSLLAQTSLTS